MAPPFVQSDVLQVFISLADAIGVRPAAQAGIFYSTQGRAYNTNPTFTPAAGLVFYTRWLFRLL